MIISRLGRVLLVLLVGLGAIFFLPKASQSSPAGIAMELPIWVDGWIGEDTAVTQREREVLAKDTQFARKIYTSPAGDKIFVSIVLSGDDMSTSIHRPERCLPAQGWSLLKSNEETIPVPQAAPLRTTRLSCAREVTAEGNQHFTINNLTYYWFVGYNQVTPSHFERTMIDLRDRIMRGYNQRWAYVTVAATVTQGIADPQRTEAETNTILQKFIEDLAPKLHRPASSLASDL